MAGKPDLEGRGEPGGGAAATAAGGHPREYGWSVHARALGILARNLWGYLALVLANAAVQVLLVWAVPVGRASLPAVTAATAASALWLFLVVAFAARLTLLALDGDGHLRPGWGGDVTKRLPRGLLWTAVTAAVTITAGFVVPWFALPVAFLLAFTPFAAVADGAGNPLHTSLLVVRQRLGRYVSVAVVEVVLLALGTAFTLLSAVFVQAPLAQFLNLVAYGLAVGWFLVALGVLFRSTNAGGQSPP